MDGVERRSVHGSPAAPAPPAPPAEAAAAAAGATCPAALLEWCLKLAAAKHCLVSGDPSAAAAPVAVQSSCSSTNCWAAAEGRAGAAEDIMSSEEGLCVAMRDHRNASPRSDLASHAIWATASLPVARGGVASCWS